MAHNIEIHSIRDRDLEAILKYFELEDAIKTGQMLCHFCARKITLDNIGAFLIMQNKPVIYCDFSECLGAASKGEG
jgi:hypothetical protein